MNEILRALDSRVSIDIKCILSPSKRIDSFDMDEYDALNA